MKKALCHNLEHIEFLDAPLPEIGDHELLLRVTHCGVCGSDIKKLLDGGLNPPQTLGHEVVGVLDQVGAEVSRFKPGDQVVVAHHVPCFDCHYCKHENYSMCRSFKESNLDPGGFAQYLRIPAAHAQMTTFKMPDSLSPQAAIFTEPLACCLRCIRRVKILPYDRVVLVGYGSIGYLIHAILKRKPVSVLVLDIDDERLALAQCQGAKTFNPKTQQGMRQFVQEETSNIGADLIIFTAGSHDLLWQSLSWVRDGGTICLFSELTGQKSERIDSSIIYKREITITSSYSPGPEDLKDAFQLIASGAVDLSMISTQEFALEDLSVAIRQVMDRKILKDCDSPRP